MKILIRFNAYGGDADIIYKGFFILDEKHWNLFKEYLQKTEEKDFYIQIDCDDKLPVHYEGCDSFLRNFKTQEISEEEYAVMKKLFPPNSENGIVSEGEDGMWTWVFDMDIFYENTGECSGSIRIL